MAKLIFGPQGFTENKWRAAESILYNSVALFLLRGSLWPCILVSFSLWRSVN